MSVSEVKVHSVNDVPMRAEVNVQCRNTFGLRILQIAINTVVRNHCPIDGGTFTLCNRTCKLSQSECSQSITLSVGAKNADVADLKQALAEKALAIDAATEAARPVVVATMEEIAKFRGDLNVLANAHKGQIDHFREVMGFTGDPFEKPVMDQLADMRKAIHELQERTAPQAAKPTIWSRLFGRKSEATS